jgi:predicted DNA-binding transcriptional regulator YafY
VSRGTTARKQLERLLYIIPAAARQNGVRISELASALGVDEQLVLRDLREATARSFHQPAGAVETFTIVLSGRRVFVRADREFHRPVRLNQRETLALGLGLRTLAAEAEPEQRSAILALASRLESQLCAPAVSTVHEQRERREEDTPAPSLDADSGIYPAASAGGFDAEPDLYDEAPPRRLVGLGAEQSATWPAEEYEPEYEDAMMLAFDDDGFRGVVADAIEQARVCTLLYLKPGDDGPQLRRVAPHRLLYASGMWYVAGHDLDRGELRIFRLDRVLAATLSAEAAPAPAAGLDALLADNGTYIAADEVEVSVRYSPRIARWIVERDSALSLDTDGSVVVRHRVADPRWIVRHVLQYGGDAVIEEPAEARSWVSESVATFG